MKKIFLFVLLSFILLIAEETHTCYAQNPEWVNYTNGNIIYSILNDGDYVWVGTSAGLVKLDKSTGIPIYLNKANSGLPDNRIYSIGLDNVGCKWFGTKGGLTKFDGINWITYNTSNSDIPDNFVQEVLIDKNNNIWVDTWNGLVKFNGNEWISFNLNNSDIPDNGVSSMALDSIGNIWFGIFKKLLKFDGNNWTVFDSSDCSFLYDEVSLIAVDNQGNKWIANEGSGLAKFDDKNWVLYKTYNSEIPTNYIRTLAVDLDGSVWFGSYDFIAKFDGYNWIIFDNSNSIIKWWLLSIMVDNNNDIWIGSQGLCMFDGVKWTNFNTSNSGLPGNYINSITFENDSTKWLVMSHPIDWFVSVGITKLTGTDNWKSYNRDNSLIPTNYVSSLAIDKYGNKWTGLLDGRVARYDNNEWLIFDTLNSNLWSDVYSIEVEESKVWIG